MPVGAGAGVAIVGRLLGAVYQAVPAPAPVPVGTGWSTDTTGAGIYRSGAGAGTGTSTGTAVRELLSMLLAALCSPEMFW